MSTTRVPKSLGRRHGTADEARSDAELMQAVARGDLGALGVVYDRYDEDVLRFLLRASAGADADDLLHETFLAVVTAAHSYDGRPSARPFLLGIAARLVSGRRRKVARWARAILSWGEVTATANERTPEAAASTAQEVAVFERALEDLPAEKRVVFLLSEAEGLSGEEIAVSLGIPAATVWTRLHYARAALRAALTKGRDQ